MAIPIFVISLASESARRESIGTQLDALGLSYQLIDAVKGSDLSPDRLAREYHRARNLKERPRELSASEIGCALSHLSIYQRITEAHFPCALILEDDAQLGNDLPEVISRLAATRSPDLPTVVLLSRIKYFLNRGKTVLLPNYRLVIPWAGGGVCGGYGYFLTQGAARILQQELFPVWIATDEWGVFATKKMIRLQAVVPYCIGLSEHAAVSSLEEGRAAAIRAAHTTRRPKVRSILLHLSHRSRRLCKRISLLLSLIRRQKQTW